MSRSGTLNPENIEIAEKNTKLAQVIWQEEDRC